MTKEEASSWIKTVRSVLLGYREPPLSGTPKDDVFYSLLRFVDNIDHTIDRANFSFPSADKLRDWPGAFHLLHWTSAQSAHVKFGIYMQVVVDVLNKISADYAARSPEGHTDETGSIPAMMWAMTTDHTQWKHAEIRFLRLALLDYLSIGDHREVVARLMQQRRDAFAVLLTTNPQLLDKATFEGVVRAMSDTQPATFESLWFLDYEGAQEQWLAAKTMRMEARRREEAAVAVVAAQQRKTARAHAMWMASAAPNYLTAVREMPQWKAMEALVGVRARETAPLTALYAELVAEGADRGIDVAAFAAEEIAVDMAMSPETGKPITRDEEPMRHRVLLSLLWKALPAWLRRFSRLTITNALDFLRDETFTGPDGRKSNLKQALALIASLIFFKGQLPSDDPLILLLAHCFFISNSDLFTFQADFPPPAGTTTRRPNALIPAVRRYATAFNFVGPSDAVSAAKEKPDFFGPYQVWTVDRHERQRPLLVSFISGNKNEKFHKTFVDKEGKNPNATSLVAMENLWAAFAGDDQIKAPTLRLLLDAMFAPPTDTVRTLCAALRRYAQLGPDADATWDAEPATLENTSYTNRVNIARLAAHFFTDIGYPRVSDVSDVRYTTARLLYPTLRDVQIAQTIINDDLQFILDAEWQSRLARDHPNVVIRECLHVITVNLDPDTRLLFRDNAIERAYAMLADLTQSPTTPAPDVWKAALAEALSVPLNYISDAKATLFTQLHQRFPNIKVFNALWQLDDHIFRLRMSAYARDLGGEGVPFNAILDAPEARAAAHIAVAFALAIPAHLCRPDETLSRMSDDCFAFVKSRPQPHEDEKDAFGRAVVDILVRMLTPATKMLQSIRGYVPLSASASSVEDFVIRPNVRDYLSGPPNRAAFVRMSESMRNLKQVLARVSHVTSASDDFKFYLADEKYGDRHAAALALLQQSYRFDRDGTVAPEQYVDSVEAPRWFRDTAMPVRLAFDKACEDVGPLLAHVFLRSLPDADPDRWLTLSNPLFFAAPAGETGALIYRWLSHAGYDNAFLDPALAQRIRDEGALARSYPAFMKALFADNAHRGNSADMFAHVVNEHGFTSWLDSEPPTEGFNLLYTGIWTLEKATRLHPHPDISATTRELIRLGLLHRAAVLEGAATIGTTALAGIEPSPQKSPPIPRFEGITTPLLRSMWMLMAVWRNKLLLSLDGAPYMTLTTPPRELEDVFREVEPEFAGVDRVEHDVTTAEEFFATYAMPEPSRIVAYSYNMRALARALADKAQDTVDALSLEGETQAPFATTFAESLGDTMKWFGEALHLLARLPGHEVGRRVLLFLAQTGPLWTALLPGVLEHGYTPMFTMRTAQPARGTPIGMFVDDPKDDVPEAGARRQRELNVGEFTLWSADAEAASAGGGYYAYPASILLNKTPFGDREQAGDSLVTGELTYQSRNPVIYRPLYNLEAHWNEIPEYPHDVVWYSETSKRLTGALENRIIQFSDLARGAARRIHRIMPLAVTEIVRAADTAEAPPKVKMSLHDLCVMSAHLSLLQTTGAPLEFGRVLAVLGGMICDVMLTAHPGLLPFGGQFQHASYLPHADDTIVVHQGHTTARIPKMTYRANSNGVAIAAYLRNVATALFTPDAKTDITQLIRNTWADIQNETTGVMLDLRRVSWHAAEMTAFYRHIYPDTEELFPPAPGDLIQKVITAKDKAEDTEPDVYLSARYHATAPSCLCVHEALRTMYAQHRRTQIDMPRALRGVPPFMRAMWTVMGEPAALEHVDVLQLPVAAALLLLARHLLEAELRVLMCACNDRLDKFTGLDETNTIVDPHVGVVHFVENIKPQVAYQTVVTKAYIPETTARLFGV